MNPPSRFLREIPKELTRFSSAGASPQMPRFMTSRFGNKTPNSNYNEYTQNSYDDDYSQVTPQLSKDSGYNKGQRVRHPTFGVGSIFSTEGAGEKIEPTPNVG